MAVGGEMPDALDLTIAMVSYNTRELTLRAIESVYEQTTSTSFELIVVDNDSHDGSADAIEEQFPSVRVIRSKDNLGFARGVNLAAEDLKSRYLLLLNPDTEVLDGAIDRLVDFAKTYPDHGIWGGRTLNTDRELDPMSVHGQMTLWNQFCRATGLAVIAKGSEFFNSEEYGEWQRDSVREVDQISGCFFLIDGDLWRELQGFDPKFFMYGEEADLCLRARSAGRQPIMTPSATIMHVSGASETVRSDKMVRLLKAKVELMKTHWPAWKQPMGVAMLAGWVGSRTAITGVMSTAGRGENFESWREILQRFPEWGRGYDK